MKNRIKVALAGNPNSGKTCVFNALTGSRQHVGNYPGVTVEKRSGQCSVDDHTVEMVDLPGTYSLSAHSLEERVARSFIVDERPDVVVNVLDATNLERNLYLTTQLADLGVPMVIAMNMSDEAEKMGIEIDTQRLGKLFGAPIVSTVGNRGTGIAELLDRIAEVAAGHGWKELRLDYGPEIESSLRDIERQLDETGRVNGFPSRWTALKLIEGDPEIRELSTPGIRDEIETTITDLEDRLGESLEMTLAQRRYGFVAGVCQEAVVVPTEDARTISDHIDRVVTNRWLAFPIFLGLMYAVFQLTFTLGEAPMGWIETGFAWVGTHIDGLWAPGTESILRSLIVDGIIGGVGGVVVFLPNIVFLFLAIAILEGSGYMARAAFIMDRLMHALGLHGKSFIPLLIGFGCSIPAIMATRSLDHERDRLTTMLVAPLMSCGARLPIYTLIIPAFFSPALHAPMLWIIYVIGIVLAIIGARILRTTIFAGPALPFVMELPPYRLPTPAAIMRQMWDRSWMYLKKAGTVILGISIVLWALTTYPKAPEHASAELSALEETRQADDLSYSVAGRVGRSLEPLLKPIGFDWKIGTALIGAVAAKEVFVAQMGIVYALGEANEESRSLRQTLSSQYTPLQGFCIMLFCLISAPCMATLAVIRRESGSWKWAIGQWTGLTVLAWLLTFTVFQIGTFLGVGA